MTFTIAAQRSPTVIRLCVSGDIDIGTAGQLDRAITDALGSGVSSLLVDLAAATFCDCAGISALLAGRRNAVARDVAYRVVNPTGVCLDIIRTLGLHRLLTTGTP